MKDTDYIGIAEGTVTMVKEQSGATASKVTFNVHLLFSIQENYLTTVCLDNSIQSRVDIMDVIRGSEESAEVLAEKILNELISIHIDDIDNHFIACVENKIAFPFAYAPDKYWKEYRIIRMDRDNSAFATHNGYTTQVSDTFLDLHERLGQEINSMRSDFTVAAFRNRFVLRINELRQAA